MLLRRAAKDYDVATNARPDEVMKLFKRTLKVGAKFGVVMVLVGKEQVEVATFRAESGYADGRHPDNVAFCSAREDAIRRDFTINGMFYDPIGREVVDYVGGQGDLKSGILRTIGDPRRRFGEDYLRMLRAVRFSTELGFKIEGRSWQAVCENAKHIQKISAERIAMELEAILTNPNRAEGVEKLLTSGLAEAIFPGLSAKSAKFGIEVLQFLRKKVNFALALAGFFADTDTSAALDFCKGLKLSKVRNRHLRFLLGKRGRLLDGELKLSELKLLLSEPYFWDLYEFQRAIQKAKGLSTGALISVTRKVRSLKGKQVKPKPLLDGHELIRLGAKPGPMVGLLAEEMYIAQLEEEIKSASQARKWARKWLDKYEQMEQ